MISTYGICKVPKSTHIYLMNCKLVETLKSTSNNAQERTSNIFLADGVALTILLGLNTKS